MTSPSAAALGFADVCAALSAHFGTRFELQNPGGNCVTLVAKLESGFEVLITDCEDMLSPMRSHLDGSAFGFYVGVYRVDADGDYIDSPGRYGCAYSETAPPTARAIADLVEAAIQHMRSQPRG
jgi:hypothetical protein